MASRLFSGSCAVVVFLAAASAAAKPPAYTVTDVPFATTLHGVVDNSAASARGLVVARGEARLHELGVDVVIREYRDLKNTNAEGLVTLSQKLLRDGGDAQEIRVVAGNAASTPTLEQIVVADACTRTVVAKVFVGLDDKVIEIETRATPDPGKDAAKEALAAMSSILHGVRIRRLGSVTLDPAKAPPAAETVAVPKPTDGC